MTMLIERGSTNGRLHRWRSRQGCSTPSSAGPHLILAVCATLALTVVACCCASRWWSPPLFTGLAQCLPAFLRVLPRSSAPPRSSRAVGGIPLAHGVARTAFHWPGDTIRQAGASIAWLVLSRNSFPQWVDTKRKVESGLKDCRRNAKESAHRGDVVAVPTPLTVQDLRNRRHGMLDFRGHFNWVIPPHRRPDVGA